jgi:dihydroorotase-like cyclic amidohydrolase
LLPALLTEGVHRRGMPLSRLASLVAAAPARLLGLARKGRLAAGMDADVALLDLDRPWTLEASALQTRSGLSGWVGRSFRGAVVRTIVRGRTVYDDGSFAEPGQARLVRRED